MVVCGRENTLWNDITRHGETQLNKKVKLLIESAARDNSAGYPVTLEYTNQFAERLTKLTVQQCAWAADFADNNPGDYVLKHFGVEE
jgi:hypothetical protein